MDRRSPVSGFPAWFRTRRTRRTGRFASAVLLLVPAGAGAYDVNDRLSIGGMLSAAGQCRQVSGRPLAEDGEVAGEPIDQGFDDTCRGALPIQLEVRLTPSARDELFVKLGWATGNGLNQSTPFRLAPWAADVEDDVKRINGSGRDYLLVARYRHAFALPGDAAVAASLGILDTTDYLDDNAYANDEYTQFMNEAFVNAGNYNLPSYDVGAAVEGRFGAASVSAVGMNINENDEGNNYNFWGVQAGWHPEFATGSGNYRFLVVGTSAAFPRADGAGRESRLGYGLSFDQALGKTVGAFLRLVGQQQEAAVDYKALYSGGISLFGSAWGREGDNIGLGYAYLAGGNTDVRRSQVVETYYRAQLNDLFALTADVQYMADDLRQATPPQPGAKGWVFGLRATAEF